MQNACLEITEQVIEHHNFIVQDFEVGEVYLHKFVDSFYRFIKLVFE